MEIIDKYIIGTTLTLVFDEAVPSETRVAIDYGENYKRNVNQGEHDRSYNTPTIVDKTVQVTLPSDASALLVITVYTNTNTLVTLFLNHYMLYKAQNEYLSKTDCNGSYNCDGCDIKKWRVATVSVLLRIRLLDYAYQNNLIQDAVEFYQHIQRVLDFKNVFFESIPENYNSLSDVSMLL